jgi:hypothetical protein
MKAYEFKAYVQNNQMTIPKDYGEILEDKSVRVIVLEKENIKEEPSIAPTRDIPLKTTTKNKNEKKCVARKVRIRESDSDNQLKNMLDEFDS